MTIADRKEDVTCLHLSKDYNEKIFHSQNLLGLCFPKILYFLKLDPVPSLKDNLRKAKYGRSSSLSLMSYSFTDNDRLGFL